MDFKIPELQCDYFGTSLHKFLSAPIGSGMLWVKKEKISSVWPLVCNDKPQSEDIRKFESLGTRSFPIEQGIGEMCIRDRIQRGKVIASGTYQCALNALQYGVSMNTVSYTHLDVYKRQDLDR